MEIAGEIAIEHKKQRVLPKHIQMAIANDEELLKLFANIQISDGGNKQFIHDFLLKPKKGKGGVAGTQEV